MSIQQVSWDQIFETCQAYSLILEDQKFTDIVAIARGGLLPAQLLGYSLRIKRIHSFGINFYEEDCAEGKMKLPFIYQQITAPLQDSKVLVVDEIVESGETFKYVLKHLKENNLCKDITTFSVFYKPCSTYKPDHVGMEVDAKTWLGMPWDN